MARLVTVGGESRRYGAVASNGEGQGFFTSGTVTADTEKQYDGSCCMKCGKSGANYVGIENNAVNINSTLGRSYWFQAAIRLSSVAPSTNLALMKIFGAANNELFLTTEEKLVVWNNTKSQVEITSSFTPEAEKTYLYTIKETVNGAGKGVLALTIRDEKGEVKYESGDKEVEIGNTKMTFWQAGHHEAGESGVDVWVSAIRLNDSTGEKETGDPGYRKLVMLKPVSDNNREGFTGGGGSTTKLYEAVDNFPPEGLSNAAKTNTSQVYSATSSTTHYYRANTATYEASIGSGGGGLIGADTIKAMIALARISNSTTTTRSMGVKSNANPEITEATASTIATATGTDPTGWNTITTGVVYDSTPTRSEGAQPQIRKNAATTNATACDMLGVYVDYLPGKEESSGPIPGSLNLLGVGR